MTGNEMLALLQQRTKIASKTKRINELRAAYRWVVRRVFNTADGPDLLCTIGEELPALVAVTRTYNLGAAVTGGELLGIKKLWVKLPSDTRFVPMQDADSDEPEFLDADSYPNATVVAASGHPVLYDAINFSQIRFAPPLPIGAVIRADYFRIGPEPGVPEDSSESESEELAEDAEVGVDLPSIFHDAMVNEATALLFNTLDDDREDGWHMKARDAINDAIYNAKRVQGPTVTQPFRARRRRYI